jgi:cobalt-zinc-cadmium efflux system outer membrane protein
MPAVLSLDDAVAYAMQYNPELAALRQQHGIAAAAVVIANTYPFNPIWEAKIRDASGPASAGITNVVSNEHKVFVDVEYRHQGEYRRSAAAAGLSRTDAEIAFQELSVAIKAIRAFDAVLYRQAKYALVEETIEFDKRVAEAVEKAIKAGSATLKTADLIVVQTETLDARAQVGPARASLVASQHELRRALGVLRDGFAVQGSLETPVQHWDSETVLAAAFERRPDLRARQAALAETGAKLELEIRNRYGNPTIGPAFEYDPTRTSLAGVQFVLPLPVFNTHQGEIMQRRAERERASMELRWTEAVVRQDVNAALARLDAAQTTAELYRLQLLPGLKKSREEIEKLLESNREGVTVLSVVDVRRKLLKARDGYLDALWELRQARADLAAAAGDPRLAIAAPASIPETLPTPKQP